MKLIALINARAGTVASTPNLDQAEHIREAFRAEQIDADVRPLEGHQLIAAAKQALSERPDAIVAGGGDGTVSGVASVLAHSDIPMGILPLGTLNHFARDLAIPIDLEGAIGIIAAGHVQSIDLARVNDRTFINNSSIGLYPQVVRDRDEQRLRLGRGKWLAMLIATLNALRRFPVLNVRIGIGDKSVLRQTPFVFVGNNRYVMSLMSVRGRHRLDEGILSLYVANRTGRFGMLRLALRALFGRLDQAKDFDSLYLNELWIETGKRRLHVALDGEVENMSPPLHYQSVPNALKVFAPERLE
ncbi:MAG TPA: diacylglycerol kinase family protein [Tepidisphaeraceae bacterium]|jgi:diacylglycerol kinase family enzyme|nr:diacylglycerol kinase family protein [Tepidisphaeraceae bacterium]